MYTSKITIQYRQISTERVCQGDIFQDLFISVGSGDDTSHIEANLEYAVILSQDCDLEQDYTERTKYPKPDKNDKHIDTILVSPAYALEDFAKGQHISERQMETFNVKKIDKLKRNDEYKRYHYLVEDIENGVPELVLDFKHFITAPRNIIYTLKPTNYVASINEIYREDVSLRFANYLSRIGLPNNKSS